MNAPNSLLCALAILFLAAMSADRRPQAPDNADEIHITYWEKWTGFEGEAARATAELFNSKKFKNAKGQTIVCKYLPVTAVDRKCLLSIAGGSPPDVAGLWLSNMYVFAEMGALTWLDEFIQRDGVAMDDYIDIYRGQCQFKTVDGVERIWCLPTTPATVALHWNKDMFRAAGLDPERPPQSLAELKEYAEKMTIRDENGKFLQFGFLPVEPGWWNWAWGYYFGGKLNVGHDRITADDPKNIEAFNWLCDFAGESKSDREAKMSFKQGFGTFDSPQNAFMSGKVAMVQQGVWMANFIRFNNPGLKWGCAPFPSAFDNGGQPVTIADMDTVTIPFGCRHPEEAWTFLKFIQSQEGVEYMCGSADNNGGQGKFSPRKDTSPDFIERHTHPFLKVFIDMAKSANASSTPRLLVIDEYRNELSAAFEKAWLGLMTPAQALTAVQERMQPKLDRALRIQRARKGAANVH
jgi:multiple sugar transport system substrate-binding protein